MSDRTGGVNHLVHRHSTTPSNLAGKTAKTMKITTEQRVLTFKDIGEGGLQELSENSPLTLEKKRLRGWKD